ncbi:MAG: 4-hydroxy-tetrahydrodipicolinate synthase [Shinella sp.]|nr:4-hydroxy-tetrahydrodipicolinate synthase [Shinella sp.]
MPYALQSPLLTGGTACDLVTPFAENGELDRVGLMALVEWQILSGISAIAVCGEPGEAATLSREERAAVIRIAVEAAERQVPVIAGTGTNATASTITLTADAKALGADAAMIVTPYYSKPTQEGILHHFEAVAAAVDIPIVICNAPGRSACDLSPRTLERLAAIPSVVGLQDCTGDIGRLVRMPRAVRERLVHYSGHDLTALAFNLSGGAGSISAAANVAPRLVCAMHHALRTGNVDAALALGERLGPLLQVLEKEPGPAAIKHAVHLVHGIGSRVRLPLTSISPDTAAAIRMALAPLPECSERRRKQAV